MAAAGRLLLAAEWTLLLFVVGGWLAGVTPLSCLSRHILQQQKSRSIPPDTSIIAVRSPPGSDDPPSEDEDDRRLELYLKANLFRNQL